MELVQEKIVPPTELPRISRPRLLKLLAKNMTCYGTTVLTGRAGTGKTLLAADFVRQAGRRVAWYKIEAPDADPQSFLRYLTASIAAQCPAFATSAQELLRWPTDAAAVQELAKRLRLSLGTMRTAFIGA